MEIKYTVGDCEVEYARSFETKSEVCKEFASDLAEEAAENYYTCGDGWEDAWPVEITVFDEGDNALGTFEVSLDFDPVFDASEVEGKCCI